MSGHIRFPAPQRAFTVPRHLQERTDLLEARILAEFAAALLPSDGPTARERALRDLAADPTIYDDDARVLVLYDDERREALEELARRPHLVHERENMAVVA